MNLLTTEQLTDCLRAIAAYHSSTQAMSAEAHKAGDALCDEIKRRVTRMAPKSDAP